MGLNVQDCGHVTDMCSFFAMDSDGNTMVQNTECEIIDAAENSKKSLPSTF